MNASSLTTLRESMFVFHGSDVMFVTRCSFAFYGKRAEAAAMIAQNEADAENPRSSGVDNERDARIADRIIELVNIAELAEV
jgi:hypothetical protein